MHLCVCVCVCMCVVSVCVELFGLILRVIICCSHHLRLGVKPRVSSVSAM